MSFKSGSKCSINNLGFSEAADTVFATLLRIRGKLFPVIKVADIRYTAEIMTLYPYGPMSIWYTKSVSKVGKNIFYVIFTEGKPSVKLLLQTAVTVTVRFPSQYYLRSIDIELKVRSLKFIFKYINSPNQSIRSVI
jgi:hypothetical protein